MEIKSIKVGYLKTNCYILIIDNDALVVDPGDDYLVIKESLGDLNLRGILITHRHFDHVGALNYFKDINVYDYSNLKEGLNKIGDFAFFVVYTMGHTSDSISFYFREYNCMFVGDFIFKNSIGRTDLDTGNVDDMKKSLLNIKSFPLDTIIYPGHGDSTILGLEIKNNPFFSEIW
ncbi:MAG: MBL fold metallo-hydrolase [Bacilli bacterium]|nr:MBL fold metallo-hydrolase [Bacilli bacterium]